MFVGNPTAFLCFSALGMPAVPAFCDHGLRSRLPLLESHAAWQWHCLTSRFIQSLSIFYIIPLNSPTEQEKQKLKYLFDPFCIHRFNFARTPMCWTHVLLSKKKREAHLHPAAWRLARPGLGQAFPRAEAPPLWATACSLGRQNVPLLRSRAQ